MTRTGAARGRRGVLRAGATVLAVGFVAGCGLPVIPRRPAPDLDAGIGWIRHEGGRFVLTIPRAEMGQNVLTALKRIACDELGADWDAVDARLASTRDIAPARATVGSESIRDFAVPLAQACAALRDALAAGGAPARPKAVERPLAALRSMRGAGRHVGADGPSRLEQGDAIVRGTALYAADVRVDGLLHGRVLRAPASPVLASAPIGADEAAARAVPGFVALVDEPLLSMGGSRGLGIVARTPGALDRIADALAPRWRVDGGFDAAALDAAVDIDRRLAASPRRDHAVHDDAIDAAAPWDVDLRIDVPLAAHAPIEPRAAVAEPADGGLRLWVGSQDPFYVRDVVARRLGLDASEVVVHGRRIGGAFGGKTICTVELEAAVLARAVRAPVKVQWTRAQEFAQGFHRPPSSHRIRARLEDGRLRDWWHAFASSHVLFTNAVLPRWMQRITDLIGDDGVARGARLPYRATARRVAFDLVPLPIATGPWRGLGAGPNGLAVESAIDECARRAGADPIAFRRAHAIDPRLARVLDRAAAAAGPRPGDGRQDGVRRGRGVACGIYKESSYAAVIADVEVDDRRGTVRVAAMCCAHDCGRVVDPDQVRAQCEGNLVWGIGMVLVEGLPVGASRVAAASFADSPIPRFADVPPMRIELVDAGEPPSGAGETAIVAAGAAVANAIRDATGVRPSRLPLRFDDLRAPPRS